jgi:tRNA splicing ligase
MNIMGAEASRLSLTVVANFNIKYNFSIVSTFLVNRLTRLHLFLKHKKQKAEANK